MGTDVRVPVTFSVSATAFVPCSQGVGCNDIDLTEKGPNGLPRGLLERIETRAADLALKMGSVHFNQEPLAGTNLSGQFHATVVTEEAELALDGTFNAMVEAR